MVSIDQFQRTLDGSQFTTSKKNQNLLGELIVLRYGDGYRDYLRGYRRN